MISLESLDRTLFELIRLSGVAKGYLADWRNTAGTGQTKIDNWNSSPANIKKIIRYKLNSIGI